MPKKCDKCCKEFKGFGTTCSTCRKGGGSKGNEPIADCARCGNFFVGFGELCPDCTKGQGPGRTGVKLPTPQEVDAVLEKIETCLKKIDVNQGSMVKLRKAELDLLGQLEIVRDLMQRILKSGDRALLKSAFLDLGRVARLRVMLDSVKLSDMNAKDQRYRTCDEVCKSIEEMVGCDMGQSDKLKEAELEEINKLLMSRVEIVLNPDLTCDFVLTLDDIEVLTLASGGYLHNYYVEPMPVAPKEESEPEIEDDDADDEDEVVDGKEQFKVFTSDVQKLFNELDADGNGLLTMDEVRNASSAVDQLLKACRIHRRKDVIKLFAEGDLDGDGTLDFDEFLNYIMTAQEKALTAAARPPIPDYLVDMIFQCMDVDGDGTIGFEELKMAYAGILLQTGEQVDPKKVERWAKKNFKKYDEDGSKALDFQEFRELIINSSTLSPLVDAWRAFCL